MFIFDLVEPLELIGYVREVQAELEDNEFTLSNIVPNRFIRDIQYKIPLGGTVEDVSAAPVRNWDAETSPSPRRGLTTGNMYGELAPITRVYKLGEEERLRLDALQRGTNDRVIDQIFDDAANGARAVAARVEMMRGEILYRRRIDFNENGVAQSVDYNGSLSHVVAPAILWSSVGTSTPISDLIAWQRIYVASNGFRPAQMLMSEVSVDQMLRSQEVRGLMADISGTPPALITRDALDQLLRTFRLPAILEYEGQVKWNDAVQRIIPEDRVIFLPPDNAERWSETLFGVTAEALELVEARQIDAEDMEGVTAVITHTTNPVSRWTQVTGTAITTLARPDYLLVADVA